MLQTARPLSPHLSIYRWQIQMVSSILHRATGVFLALGSILLCIGLLALDAGVESFATLQKFTGSWLGLLLLVGWTWSFCYHLLNGLRHLSLDAGWGFQISQFVCSGWIAVCSSLLLTLAIWIYVFMQGGHA